MSGQATGWVLRHGPKDRAMRAVLITIADAANRDGEHAHPGLAAMVEGSLYGRAHVLATVKRLVEAGWLEVEEEGVGRGHATVYRVRMDRRKVQPVDPSDGEDEHDEKVQPVDPLLDPSDGKGPICGEKRSNPDREKVQSSHPSPISSTVNLNGKPLRAENVPLAAGMAPEGCRSLAAQAHLIRSGDVVVSGEHLNDIVAAVGMRRGAPLSRQQAVQARDVIRDRLPVWDVERIVAALAATSAFTTAAVDFADGQRNPRKAMNGLTNAQRTIARLDAEGRL